MFGYKEKCYVNCPEELIADNIDMICKKENDNPVYIKAYSVSRCVNSCGNIFKDCSCKESCLRNGTCCSDFRFCQVIKENHTSNTKIPNCKFADENDSICLQCKDNFYYFNNQCLQSCSLVNNKPDNNIIISYKENKLCKEINLGN